MERNDRAKAGHDDGVQDRSEAFERLYADHAPALLAYTLRRICYDVAQDVVAETFMVAWRRFDDWPREPLPWLYGIARRVLANQRRTGQRRALLEKRLIENIPALPVSVDGAVLDVLGSLGEGDRELLMLVAWEGLRPAEAAAVLGCSANACRIRLHRARRKFARALESRTHTLVTNPKPREAR